MVHRILSGSSTEPYLVLQVQHDEYIAYNNRFLMTATFF